MTRKLVREVAHDPVARDGLQALWPFTGFGAPAWALFDELSLHPLLCRSEDLGGCGVSMGLGRNIDPPEPANLDLNRMQIRDRTTCNRRRKARWNLLRWRAFGARSGNNDSSGPRGRTVKAKPLPRCLPIRRLRSARKCTQLNPRLESFLTLNRIDE